MDLKRQRLVVGFVAALGNNSLGVVVNTGEKMHQKTPHRRPFYFVSSLGLIVGQLSCLWLTLGIRRGARNVDGKARVTKLRLQDAAQAVFVFDYQEGRIARLRSGPAY